MQPGKRSKASRITPETFAAVIRAFMASPKFASLAKATRTNYGHYLRIAERPDVLGAFPVAEMRPKLVQAFLDGFADRPSGQKVAQTAIKSLERWAIVRDLLPHPITMGTESIYDGGATEPWTDAQVTLAEQHARPDLSRLVTLAANTGQRGSDLVRMRWSDVESYQGRSGINVIQKKTGLKLWIPLTQELQRAIDTWDKRPGYFVLKPKGGPYTRQQLSDTWLRHRNSNPALAPLKAAGLTFHGLRATAVIRLRRAGVSIPLICDMIGMSPPMVQRYCRLSVQKDNAMAAVHVLDGTARERSARDGKRNGT